MTYSDEWLRVLLDTSVLVSAFRSQVGASNILLNLAFENRFQIAASTAVFLEYEDVLQRELQRNAHGRSMADVDAFLVALSKIIYPIELYFQWRPQLADPNDEMSWRLRSTDASAQLLPTTSAILSRRSSGLGFASPSQFLQELRNERSR